MSVYLLSPYRYVFPHPLVAEEYGIVAIDGDLAVERLMLAYAFGIFPWYNEYEPILWWFPDPRCVLFPDDLKVSKSLRSLLRKKRFEVTLNTCFRDVITQCSTIPRKGQEGTWLHPEMIVAYTLLHKAGMAHSVEVWQEGELVGGLYGVALGRIFFGESMFSAEDNASKVALVELVDILKRNNFALIDCQQDTPHMRSLGARVISAADFYWNIRKNLPEILRSDFPHIR